MGVVLSACAPATPPLKKPLALSQLQLPQDLLGSAPNPASRPAEWWQTLAGPALTPLLQRALAHNPSLAEAEARVRAAAGAVQEAGATLEPQLSAHGRLSGNHWTQNQFYPPPYGGRNTWNNAANVDLSYHLDLWGKDKDQRQARQADLRARTEEARAAALILEGQVLRTAVDRAATTAMLQNAKSQREVLNQILKIARDRQTHGLSNGLERIVQADALNALDLRVQRLEEAARMQDTALAILVGQGAVLPPQASVERWTLNAHWQVPQQVPAELLGQRPDVQVRRAQMTVAAAEIRVARADFYPNINLVAFAGGLAAAGSFLQFFHPSSLQYGAGPAISLPLFTGGRLRGQLHRRAADYDAAVARYDQTLLHGLQEVSDALIHLQTAAHERQELQERAKLLRKTQQIQDQRWSAGLQNALPSLETRLERLHLAAQDVAINAAALKSLTTLQVALGGTALPQVMGNAPNSQALLQESAP